MSSPRLRAAFSKVGRPFVLKKMETSYDSFDQNNKVTVTSTSNISGVIIARDMQNKEQTYNEKIIMLASSTRDINMQDVISMDGVDFDIERLEFVHSKSEILCYEIEIIR